MYSRAGLMFVTCPVVWMSFLFLRCPLIWFNCWDGIYSIKINYLLNDNNSSFFAMIFVGMSVFATVPVLMLKFVVSSYALTVYKGLLNTNCCFLLHDWLHWFVIRRAIFYRHKAASLYDSRAYFMSMLVCCPIVYVWLTNIAAFM